MLTYLSLIFRDVMGGLKKNKIELSRDMLSKLAIEEPKVFDILVAIAKED